MELKCCILDPDFSVHFTVDKNYNSIDELKMEIANQLSIEIDQFSITNLLNEKELTSIPNKNSVQIKIIKKCKDIKFHLPNNKHITIPNCYKMKVNEVINYFENNGVYFSEECIKHLRFQVSNYKIINNCKYPFYAISTKNPNDEVHIYGKYAILDYGHKKIIFKDKQTIFCAKNLILKIFNKTDYDTKVHIQEEKTKIELKTFDILQKDTKYFVYTEYSFTFTHISSKKYQSEQIMDLCAKVADAKRRLSQILSDTNQKYSVTVIIYKDDCQTIADDNEFLKDIKNSEKVIYFEIIKNPSKSSEKNSNTNSADDANTTTKSTRKKKSKAQDKSTNQKEKKKEEEESKNDSEFNEFDDNKKTEEQKPDSKKKKKGIKSIRKSSKSRASSRTNKLKRKRTTKKAIINANDEDKNDDDDSNDEAKKKQAKELHDQRQENDPTKQLKNEDYDESKEQTNETKNKLKKEINPTKKLMAQHNLQPESKIESEEKERKEEKHSQKEHHKKVKETTKDSRVNIHFVFEGSKEEEDSSFDEYFDSNTTVEEIEDKLKMKIGKEDKITLEYEDREDGEKIILGRKMKINNILEDIKTETKKGQPIYILYIKIKKPTKSTKPIKITKPVQPTKSVKPKITKIADSSSDSDSDSLSETSNQSNQNHSASSKRKSSTESDSEEINKSEKNENGETHDIKSKKDKSKDKDNNDETVLDDNRIKKSKKSAKSIKLTKPLIKQSSNSSSDSDSYDRAASKDTKSSHRSSNTLASKKPPKKKQTNEKPNKKEKSKYEESNSSSSENNDVDHRKAKTTNKNENKEVKNKGKNSKKLVKNDDSKNDKHKYFIRKNREDEIEEIELDAGTSVEEMKQIIAENNGVDSLSNIKVIFAGKDLLNELILDDLEIGDTVLYVYIRSIEDILLMTAKALIIKKEDLDSIEEEDEEEEFE